MSTNSFFYENIPLLIGIITQIIAISALIYILNRDSFDKFFLRIIFIVLFFIVPFNTYNIFYTLTIQDIGSFYLKIQITLLILFFLLILSSLFISQNVKLKFFKVLEKRDIRNIIFFLAIISFVGSIFFSYIGYTETKYAIENKIIDESNTIINFVKYNSNIIKKDENIISKINYIFNKTINESNNMNISLISPSGRIIFDTDLNNIGVNFYDNIKKNMINTPLYGSFSNSQKKCLFIYTPISHSKLFLSVYTYSDRINKEIYQIVIYWLYGVIFLTFILFPMALALLNLSYSYSEKLLKEGEEKLKESNEKLMESLEEKEILFKELHHRVKNNLQVIYSLLGLQAKSLKDESLNIVIKETQNRVKTMSLIHEKLYQTNEVSKINFGDYIISLVNSIAESYNFKLKKILLEFDFEKAFFPLDISITCGLIINEIISNSFKYAFEDLNQAKNIISIIFYKSNDTFNLIIKDNGKGIKIDTEHKINSLGTKLIKTLVKQINGSLALDTSNGTCYTLLFKV